MDMNQMPMGSAPAPQKASGMSIAAMVCGIVSIVMYCCYTPIGLVLGIVAIVLAVISMKKQEGGKGMAIAGLVCGIVAVVLCIVSYIALLACQSAINDSLNSLYSMGM